LKLSIVVPCYDEEEVIQETNATLLGLAKSLVDTRLIEDYEIIYVNDGSADNTLSILKSIANGNKEIRVISLSRNFGHQAALVAGLYHAAGDAVVSLDADLQDPPEIIKEMVQRFREGYAVVSGVRTRRDKDSLFKRLTARSFYKLMALMGVNLISDHGDFRLLSRNVVDGLKEFTEVNLFLRGLIPALGFRQCTVEYERQERFAGRTKYPLRKMLAFALEGITSFSLVPLRVASVIGIVIFLCTLPLSVWVFATKLAGRAVPGWASTVLPIYFIGGIQLSFLGILGEYVGKIYMEVKKRPLFIIGEKYNFDG
jgi:polyisoprenyl-phosphate glycosyltransferase